MKKWIVVASILVVVSGVLFVGRQSRLKAAQAPKTVTVVRGSVAQEALAIGSIVPDQEISVKSKVPGIVAHVHVAIGDAVREGDPLIDVRPDPTPIERAEAERGLEIAQVAADGAARDLERARRLSAQNLVSDKALQDAVQADETARLRAKLEEERLQLLREGRASIGGNMVSNRITAPATGTILSCEVHPGDPVVPLTSYQEGTVLITMADMATLIFRGTVDEVDVGKLSTGQPVRFTVGAIPNAEVTGVLRRISPKARKQDATTLFDIEAEIADPNGTTLRAGYSATAKIAISRADSVLVLPERVVKFADGKASVRIPGKDGKPVERPIVTGLSDGLSVEVKEGLALHDLVLEPESTIPGTKKPSMSSGMHSRIVLSQFWRDLKAQRLRTGLTLFGLGWGTFCVIVLLSFGEGLQRKQMQDASAIGERMLLIWGSRTSLSYQGLPRGRYIQIKDADADILVRDVPGVAAASPEYEIYRPMRGPGGEGSFGIAGVRPCYGPLRKVEPAPGGRFINEMDEKERRRVAIIGDQVRRDLFGDVSPIGRTFEISGIPFLVVGTLAPKKQNSNYSGPDDRKIFIPSAAAQASLGVRYPDNLVVEVRADAKSKAVMKDIQHVLARVHNYDPEDSEALMSWDVGDMLAMMMNIFLGFKVFLSLVGALTLAVAGIGVANIMNMAVEDRTSQIGIAMALGARRGWVLTQVLLETLLVTAVGGGLGILLASGVVSLGALLPIKDNMGTPVFSGQIAVLTAGLLGAIGIISGMGPARRAAQMRPAEALRS